MQRLKPLLTLVDGFVMLNHSPRQVRFAVYALLAGLGLQVLHGLGGVDFGFPAVVFDDVIYHGLLIGARSSAGRARSSCARSGWRGR